MIKIVTFRPEHAEQIELGAWHSSEVTQEPLTGSVTFIENDKPSMIIGSLVNGHICHLWGWVSKNVTVKVARPARTFLKEYAMINYIRRIQMTVRADFPRGLRFAEFLGFEKEGIMKSYGKDGADYILFARVFQ
jgi:RimJ/RimL family protein N-acetyltransferase